MPSAADARPTFVLVHGSCGSSFMWAPIQRELALLGHRSFAVDLPGHGFDAQYPVAYQAPQDLDAWAAEPSTLAGVCGTASTSSGAWPGTGRWCSSAPAWAG